MYVSIINEHRRAQLSQGSTTPKEEILGGVGKLAKHDPERKSPL